MPRARDPNRGRAFQIYKDADGKIDLVEIASQLNISAGTVRGWKSKDKWEEQLNGTLQTKVAERSTKVTERSKRSKGGQPGNKNAKGSKGGSGSAPLRNKNAEKHGAYSTFYWDTLTEEEIHLMQDISNSEEELLQQQIAMYTVRERKFMHQIKSFKEKSEKGLYVKGVTKKVKTDFDESVNKVGKAEETDTSTEYAIKGLAALEAELTKIQRAKTKCIDSLIRLRIADERHDYLLNGWKSKMEADNSDVDNEESDDVMIYLPENGRDKE